MAGPPTNSFGDLQMMFSSNNLPLGAMTSIGVGGFLGEPEEVLDELSVMVDSLVAGLCSSTVACHEVRLKVGPVATGPTFSKNVSHAGTRASETESPNTALLVRKAIPAFSQRFAGRMYIPGIASVDVQSNGFVAPTALTAFQATLDTFFASLEASTAVSGAFVFGSGDVTRPISALQAQPVAATQRRRMRR